MTTINELLHPDVLQAQVPAFFYQRNNLFQKAIIYFLIPIDYGFAYLLRSIRMKWGGPSIPNGANKYRQIKVQFIQSYAARKLQNEPLFSSLLCTPGGDGVAVVPAPAPYDPTALNVNMTATPVKNNIILNYVYQRRETLDLRFQFDIALNVGESIEGKFDILLDGYYLPDQILDEWK